MRVANKAPSLIHHAAAASQGGSKDMEVGGSLDIPSCEEEAEAEARGPETCLEGAEARDRPCQDEDSGGGSDSLCVALLSI